MEFPWSYWGTTCGHASGYRKTPRRPSSFRMATKSNRVTSLVHLEGPIDYTGKAGPEVCRSLAGSQGRSPEFDMGLGKGWNNGISTHRKFILEGMCCFQVSLPPVHPLAKNYTQMDRIDVFHVRWFFLCTPSSAASPGGKPFQCRWPPGVQGHLHTDVHPTCEKSTKRGGRKGNSQRCLRSQREHGRPPRDGGLNGCWSKGWYARTATGLGHEAQRIPQFRGSTCHQLPSPAPLTNICCHAKVPGRPQANTTATNEQVRIRAIKFSQAQKFRQEPVRGAHCCAQATSPHQRRCQPAWATAHSAGVALGARQNGRIAG